MINRFLGRSRRYFDGLLVSRVRDYTNPKATLSTLISPTDRPIDLGTFPAGLSYLTTRLDAVKFTARSHTSLPPMSERLPRSHASPPWSRSLHVYLALHTGTGILSDQLMSFVHSERQRRSFMMHRKNHYPHPLTRPSFSRVSFGLYTDGTMILRTPSIHYAYTLLIQRYSGPTVSPATYLQEKHTRPSSLLAPTGYDYFTPVTLLPKITSLAFPA